jgi:murein DD-endopeptidase MepM/ murein hydrolase activator NlpD
VSFRGDEQSMLDDGDAFWLPLGASAEAALGDSEVLVRLFDGGGAAVDTREATVSVTATDFPVEAIEVAPDGPNGLRSADEVQQELNIRAAVYARFTPRKLWSGAFIQPVQAPITTDFGTARSYNGGPPSLHHSGTDFGADEGTAVHAAAAGRVAFAGMLTTRGNSVLIDHGGGVFTAYHHLSRIDAAEGQDIAQGQVLGAVGMTGLATGPHLHWELVVGGVNVDPMPWTVPGVAP